MKAIILVGGEGTRLRPLTYLTTKSMVPVLNKPFIEYAIRYLHNHKVDEVILAMGHKPDSIKDYFSNASRPNIKLTYSIEQKPLGTAGAVKNAEQNIDGTFFVINGDIFTDINLTDMLDFHRKKNAKVTIALTPVEDPTQFGVVETDGQQRVTRFVEKPSLQQVTSHMINAGVYILEGETLRHIPPDRYFMFERDVFPRLVDDRESVFGYTSDSYWIDMGTTKKYLQLNHDLLYGKSLQAAYQAEAIHVHEQSSVHAQSKLTGPILIDRGCTISRGAQLLGPVVIGSDCHIHDNAIIDGSVLWQKISVGKHATLRNCIVASGSYIEDNARIENSTISQHTTSE